MPFKQQLLIVASRLATALTGNRVEIEQNGGRGEIFFFSGDAGEVSAAQITSGIQAGSDSAHDVEFLQLGSGRLSSGAGSVVSLLSKSRDNVSLANAITLDAQVVGVTGVFEPNGTWARGPQTMPFIATIHALTVTIPTGGNGKVTVPHGLSGTPNGAAFCNAISTTFAGGIVEAHINSIDATNVTLRFFSMNGTGNVINLPDGESVTVDILATIA